MLVFENLFDLAIALEELADLFAGGSCFEV